METEISARLHLPHYLLDCELVRYLESQGPSMEVEAMQRPSVLQCFTGDVSIDSIGHSGSLEKQELAPFVVFLSFSHYSCCQLGIQGLKIALHACAVLMGVAQSLFHIHVFGKHL